MSAMEEHIRLGRIAGVRLGATWSLLALFCLIMGTLAALELPRAAPGYPPVAYGLAAVATAVLFYQALIAHELAHAIVARRAGMRVAGILLCVLGGVSMLEGEPPAASVELRVALAGPVASAVLAGAFLGIGRLIDATGGGSLLTGALYWLATTSALLTASNLLPAYPLDGGRVLRSLLWQWHGDRDRATAQAHAVRRALGAALIAVGSAGLVVGVAGSHGYAGFTGLCCVVTGGLLAGLPQGDGVRRPSAPFA